MIIRRRVLLEAEDNIQRDENGNVILDATQKAVEDSAKREEIKNLLETEDKWDLSKIAERFNKANTKDREKILDATVLHFVYKDKKEDNYKNFEKLDYTNVKYPWIQALGFETFNQKLFPFFAFIKNIKAKDIISNNNNAFLKSYNYILDNKNLTFIKLSNPKAENTNIIFVSDLYSKPDYEAIADLYYRTNYNEKWKTNLDFILKDTANKENHSIRALLSGFRQFVNIKSEDIDKLKFKTFIFYKIINYEDFNINSKVRDLSIIKAILEALDENIKFNNVSDTAKKALKNVTKKEDIEALAKNFTKEQAQIAMPILQQTVNG